MRILLIFILFLLIGDLVYGANSTQLVVKVKDATPHKAYFLCISNGGCVRIFAPHHAKAWPMNPGMINYIQLANGENLHSYPQILPASCQIEVKTNDQLTVTGQVQLGKNSTPIIKDLQCVVNH